MAPRRRSAQDRREAAQARRAEVTDIDVVMEAAATFLAIRPRSVAETRRRLRYLGFPAALCDEVVDRLVELDYLDDRTFARTWVESRDRARPRGVMALRQELQQKGVPRDLVDEILDERSEAAAHTASAAAEAAGSADVAAARSLLERRAVTLRREQDPRRQRHKAYALLARHGFTPDVCGEVASDFVEAAMGQTDEGV